MKYQKLFVIVTLALVASAAFAGGVPYPIFEVTEYSGTYDNIIRNELGRTRGRNLADDWASQRTLQTKDGISGFWGVVGHGNDDNYVVLPGFGTDSYNGGAYDIANTGHVAGYAYHGNQSDAVVWRNGGVENLGIKEGLQTQAVCISDRDELVGFGEEFLPNSGIRRSAYYWSPLGEGFNLNNCLSAQDASHWYLTNGYAVTNAGEIFGSGILDGRTTLFQAHRATAGAVPEPGSLALVLSSLLPLGGLALRRRR